MSDLIERVAAAKAEAEAEFHQQTHVHGAPLDPNQQAAILIAQVKVILADVVPPQGPPGPMGPPGPAGPPGADAPSYAAAPEGLPAQSGTEETDADERNPNVGEGE